RPPHGRGRRDLPRQGARAGAGGQGRHRPLRRRPGAAGRGARAGRRRHLRAALPRALRRARRPGVPPDRRPLHRLPHPARARVDRAPRGHLPARARARRPRPPPHRRGAVQGARACAARRGRARPPGRGRALDQGSVVTQPPDGLPELPDDFDFDAEFARAFGPRTPDGETPRPPVGSPTPGGTRPRAIVAVVLTPVSSAPALAGLCAMAGIDATVVPTSRGALAARVIERAGDGDDALAELIGEAPEIATSMAAALSRTSRYGAILLVSRLGEGDEGLVGTIVASQ